MSNSADCFVPPAQKKWRPREVDEHQVSDVVYVKFVKVDVFLRVRAGGHI